MDLLVVCAESRGCGHTSSTHRVDGGEPDLWGQTINAPKDGQAGAGIRHRGSEHLRCLVSHHRDIGPRSGCPLPGWRILLRESNHPAR